MQPNLNRLSKSLGKSNHVHLNDKLAPGRGDSGKAFELLSRIAPQEACQRLTLGMNFDSRAKMIRMKAPVRVWRISSYSEAKPLTIPQFEFSIAPGEALGVGREVAEAEKMGYARVGIWDSPALFREPWVTLASVARDTEQIPLGTWVTNPLSRHPEVTASAAASLDDLAPGRVYLGLGTGDTGVLHLGLRGASLAQMESYALAVRQLLEAGRADYRGQAVQLKWAKRHIPIIMAARGAKSLRLTGRIADGVVIGLGVTPEVVQGALELVEQGAHEAEHRLAERLGIREYFQRRFSFAETPDEVEQQLGVAMQAGATKFDGAIDTPLPEHRERISQLAELVMRRFQ